MGRRTYEGFAPVWAARSGDPASDRINEMEKWVASTTLTDPAWNNTDVIASDLAGEISRRKEQPGRDIVQYGIGPVTDMLLEHGLLDEVRLWIHPLMVGRGSASDLLFRDGRVAHLDLANTEALASGIVILTYTT